MIPLAFLLLFASGRVSLVDEVYQVPANEWRYVEIALSRQAGVLRAAFEVEKQPAGIRMALLRPADLDRLRNERPHGVLAATASGSSGRLWYPISQPGDYDIVLDNNGDSSATVRLRVWLDSAGAGGPAVTFLSPRRQLTVILISFGVFFGVVTWSARRLWRTMR